MISSIYKVETQGMIFSRKNMHSKMTFCMIKILFEIGFFAVISNALPITGENDAALYLRRFGYLPESANQEIAAVSVQEVSSAIRDFQKFAGLQETGTLTTETINMMNTPRCGVKDNIRNSQSARMKRYALQGSKWHSNEITYYVRNFPSRISGNIGNSEIRSDILRGLKAWSDVAKIDFKEKTEGLIDIDIKFAAGNHGDGYNFDGPWGTVAHAFFPQYGGDVHFDDDETWGIHNTDFSALNMFETAAHEFGHSLGLWHSNEKLAVMYPFVTYIPFSQLHSDDINAIRAIYGSRNQSDDENLGPQPDTTDAPDLCRDATIDTITRVKSGSTYVFRGNFYWKIISTGGVANGYPRKISEDWGGLEGNLDASVTSDSGLTYFFKGNRYWCFTNRNMESGYPKYISEGWPGIPDDLDAAYVWGKNGKTYFFKGDKYWRFDFGSSPPVAAGFPRPAAIWSSMLASGIDAAFQWENGVTYFFKGGQYYQYNDEFEQIDHTNTYPRSTSEQWFNCA